MPDFPPAKYIDDVTCRDLWVETTQVLRGPPGSMKMEFCVNRWTVEVPVHRDRITPVARIAMTVGQAEMLRDQITANLEGMKQEAALEQAPPASQMKN